MSPFFGQNTQWMLIILAPCQTSLTCLCAGLLNHYGGGHHDYTDTNMALSKVRTIIKKLSAKLKESVRF